MKYIKSIASLAILMAVIMDCSKRDPGPQVVATCLLDSMRVSGTFGYTNYYTYDASDKLMGGTLVQGSAIYPVSYVYNDQGQITSRSQGQFVTNYVFDNLGNLVQETEVDYSRINYTYNPTNQISRLDYFLYDFRSADFVLIYFYTRTYATTRTNNPSTMKMYNATGILMTTYAYEYDDKYNPLVPVSISAATVPFNNERKLTATMASGAATTTNYTYTYNSSGYPLTQHGEISSGTTTDVVYAYVKCY